MDTATTNINRIKWYLKDQEWDTPLWCAIQECDTDKMIKILKESPHLVGHTDQFGRNYLHVAPVSNVFALETERSLVCGESKMIFKNLLKLMHREKAEDTTEILLQYGCNIKAVSKQDDCNVLHIAALFGSCKTLSILLDKTIESKNGDMINSKNILGETPFICCITTQDEEMKQDETILYKWMLLYSYGANIESKDSSGLDALYYALEFQKILCTKFLLYQRPSLLIRHTSIFQSVDKKDFLINTMGIQDVADVEEYIPTALDTLVPSISINHDILSEIFSFLSPNESDLLLDAGLTKWLYDFFFQEEHDLFRIEYYYNDSLV